MLHTPITNHELWLLRISQKAKTAYATGPIAIKLKRAIFKNIQYLFFLISIRLTPKSAAFGGVLFLCEKCQRYAQKRHTDQKSAGFFC